MVIKSQNHHMHKRADITVPILKTRKEVWKFKNSREP